MKPPATAIVDNLVWGSDGGVWAVWSTAPLPTAHQPLAVQVDVHSQLRGLLLAWPEHSMLLSICERVAPGEITHRMNLPDERPVWVETLAATEDLLGEYGQLYERRYYIAARVGTCGPTGFGDRVRRAFSDVGASFGATVNRGPTVDEVERHSRTAGKVSARLASSAVRLERVGVGELRWLYARALRREIAEPSRHDRWEPDFGSGGGVLAQLTDAQCQEGGTKDDRDRPRHRRYMRVVSTDGRVGFQSVLALADVPHEFFFPGGGECLYGAEQVGFPVDWCVRNRAVDNQTARAKLLRQHRELVGQFGEYEGEVTGVPPELNEAVAGIEDMRARLAASPNEPELWATILFSIAAPDLVSLEDRAETLTGMFAPFEFGLGRPTGSQVALARAFLPGSDAPSVCDDYRQYLTAGDLAGFGPLTAAHVGDPSGLLLGLSLDAGVPTPVLFDPAYGPTINSSASLVACGALGSGKSYLLKRLVVDTVARGGQVVTMDRTARREYVQLANAMDGVECAVVDLTSDSTVSLDPLRCFTGPDRVGVTLGFLQLLVGCPTQSEEGSILAEAVQLTADAGPDTRLSDVIGRLEEDFDEVSTGLARKLRTFPRLGLGQLVFADDGESLPMSADLIVFSAPHLALPNQQTVVNEHLAAQMLPEQILGQAILYLVAAVSRHIVFSDPSRFGAALYDEAASLLASPHGRQLVMDGITDGRKHNGAIWIASQHPNHFADPELIDLLGPRFIFRQDGRAASAAMALLGGDSNPQAENTLTSLTTGQCLYRDVRRRVGAIQVLPPALHHHEAAFDTRPTTTNPHDDERDPPEQQIDIEPRKPTPAPTTPDGPGLEVAHFDREHAATGESRDEIGFVEEFGVDFVDDEGIGPEYRDLKDEITCPVVALPEPVDLAAVRARAWARRSNPLSSALTDADGMQ